jgi:hypothetical protein
MHHRFLARTIAALCLMVPIGWLALGQAQPPARPAPDTEQATTRDNFAPEARKRRRLSREEFEKATKTDEEADRATEERTIPRAATALKSRPRVIPPHRLTRDVMLGAHPAARTANTDGKEWQITLKNAFIEKYKNRATLTTPYQVVAHRYHPVSEDGDAHVAGLSDEVGLPCVAELMNVKDLPEAKQLVEDHEESGQLVPVVGVPRLWCEHPDQHRPAGPQIQDDVIPEYVDSNPNHVFEIHPIVRIGNVSVSSSFQPIPPAFERVYDAKKAFDYYESITCRIVPDPANQTTTLYTPKARYNYVKFVLKTEEDQQFITIDGRFVRCSVQSADGEPVAHNRRMVFVKDTPPEKAIRNQPKGTTLTVLGIPRIDLALVSYRTRVSDAKPEALEWNLPYEIIVVGVYTGEEL